MSNNIECPFYIATVGWSSVIQLWDEDLNAVGIQKMAHEDWIVNMDIHNATDKKSLITTASIDTTAKLWSVTSPEITNDQSAMMEDNEEGAKSNDNHYKIQKASILKGHSGWLG